MSRLRTAPTPTRVTTDARRRPSARTFVSIALTSVLLSSAAAGQANAAPRASFASEAGVARQGFVELQSQLRDQTSSTDQQFWRDGIFVSADMTCAPCHLGPATAAATMRFADPAAPAWLDSAAIASFERSLADLQPDGTYNDPTNGSKPIATMFFANEFGTALVHLRDRLPAATTKRWTDALRRAADRVIRTRELTFYANGNIQLGYAEMMYLTYVATGEKTYLDQFETAWSWAIAPPRGTGPARGLITTKASTNADGRDGAGYLTETGAGGTGYDPYYSVLQIDILSRLYLLSRDPRVLRVLNLVTNQQLQRVGDSWLLDTRGGTRITNAGFMPFTTGAVQVLAMSGKRPDLLTKARAQFPRLVAEAAAIRTRGDHIQYRNVGTEFGTVYQAMFEGIDGEAATPRVALTRSRVTAVTRRSAKQQTRKASRSGSRASAARRG